MTWYDKTYPGPGPMYDPGDRILVTDLEHVEMLADFIENTAGDADTEAIAQWLLVSDDPKEIFAALPAKWRNLEFGIPRNVWVGLRPVVDDPRQQLKDLLTIRARRRFVVVPKLPFDLSTFLFALNEALEAWRCMHCGRRGQAPRPLVCPSGSICLGEEDKIGPQIHWVIEEFRSSYSIEIACKDNGVAYWPEVPK